MGDGAARWLLFPSEPNPFCFRDGGGRYHSCKVCVRCVVSWKLKRELCNASEAVKYQQITLLGSLAFLVNKMGSNPT